MVTSELSLEERTARVREESAFVTPLLSEIGKMIVGQEEMVRRILIGLLADGHLLLEGVPGLAKTLAVKTVSDTIDAKFHRIQFTPDLLPADLTGTLVFDPKSGKFTPKLGPVFTQILLADEINRAPAKVQSALLEAMQERQVTIGDTTYPLDSLFWVLATQNPIEQEGTYPLPEAQMDRFLLKIRVGYPTPDEEGLILDRMGGEPPAPPKEVVENSRPRFSSSSPSLSTSIRLRSRISGKPVRRTPLNPPAAVSSRILRSGSGSPLRVTAFQDPVDRP